MDGPEVSRPLATYEAVIGNIDISIDSRQHEATVVTQTYLFENMQAMTTVLQGTCNPFQDAPSELYRWAQIT